MNLIDRLESSRPKAFRAAAAILDDRRDAEDVLQDAALTAWRRIGQLRDESAFGAWFLRIVVNKAKDLLDRRRRGRWLLLALQVTPTTSAVDRETRMDLWQAVRQLPEWHRKIVRLHYRDGHSTPQIAKMLGRSEGRIRGLLSESYSMLRERL